MGVLGCRPLHCGGPAVRLPGSFPCDSSSFQCSHPPFQLLSVFHQGISSDRCGGGSEREGRYRACSPFSRLLQPPLCHPQSHRGLAACRRPLPSQPVCSSLPFSHGDSTVGPPVSASWGLDGFSGPEGRLPSGSGSSRVSLLPEILWRRGGLSISCSLFWPFNCPAGVHACHGPDFVDYASSWVPDPEVPRRLASPQALVSEPGSGEGLSHMALPGARCPGQPGEELSDSHSDLGLPGDAASDASFEGFPDPQACPEARISAFRLRLLSSAASGSLASAAGSHVVSGVDCFGVSAPDAVSPAASELRRPSSAGIGQRGLGFLLPRGSLVVVRRVPSSRRSSPGSLSSQPVVVHRRLGFRLGGFPQRRPHLRLMVSQCSSFLINHRELLAVLYRVQGFLPLLRHRSVSLFADNTTALAYLRNQGGTHSSLLNSVTQAVLRLCEVHRVKLVVQFIPGRLNVLADTLSCRSQVLGSEWTLCFLAFRDLLLLWPATIDLFATSLNHCLPVYFSPMYDPQSVGTDAMMQPWDGLQAYAFPPFGLLQRIIAKVRQSRGLELTLVAPFWPQHPWFPDLLELLVAVPVFLPRRKDLLRQPHFQRFHQKLRVLQLTAYRILSDPPAPSASLRRWLDSLPAADAPPPE